ncbi:hypothetical protein [Pseudomonas phage ZCPS1]|nr:hypothetical protein [Pseudomonas phage ZCPS1]
MIYIYKGNRASNGAVALRNALGGRILRSEGSTYRGRQGSMVINWGTQNQEAERLRRLAPIFLNNPQVVSMVTKKDEFFRHMQTVGPDLIPRWTNNFDDAAALVNNGGGRIFVRTQLNGHSGQGISLLVSTRDAEIQAIQQLIRSRQYPVYVMGVSNIPDEVINARLFTQGIVGRRTEFRIHVVRGRAILSQVKLRRNVEENTADDSQSIVRNVAGGWVYGVNDAEERQGHAQAVDAAIQAVNFCGLDFGAVDIVYKHETDRAYVLEINTAPGLDEGGSALEAYTQAFTNIYEEGVI